MLDIWILWLPFLCLVPRPLALPSCDHVIHPLHGNHSWIVSRVNRYSKGTSPSLKGLNFRGIRQRAAKNSHPGYVWALCQSSLLSAESLFYHVLFGSTRKIDDDRKPTLLSSQVKQLLHTDRRRCHQSCFYWINSTKRFQWQIGNANGIKVVRMKLLDVEKWDNEAMKVIKKDESPGSFHK